MPYLSASAVVIHYEEALYQVYAPLPYLYLTFPAAEHRRCLAGIKLYCLASEEHGREQLAWRLHRVPEIIIIIIISVY